MPVCFTSSEDSGGGSTTPHDRDQSFLLDYIFFLLNQPVFRRHPRADLARLATRYLTGPTAPRWRSELQFGSPIRSHSGQAASRWTKALVIISPRLPSMFRIH